jgi:putative thioredoxin
MSDRATSNPAVVDVTDATFQSTVIEESYRRPVVVDFWAAWCQPCRMIGPVLERLAAEKGGAFLLAKLDTDANPQASAYFRIQSIPAVKAFRDGALVNEFIGAIPEASIRQFLDAVLPSEADAVAQQGLQAEEANDLEEADRLYRSAVALDPHHREGSLGQARVAIARGRPEQARPTLEALRPDPEAERLLAVLDVSTWADQSANGAVGPIAEAERAAAAGRFQDALDVFLAAVQNGTDEDRQAAREAMLKVFAVLGEGWRRRCSSARPALRASGSP